MTTAPTWQAFDRAYQLHHTGCTTCRAAGAAPNTQQRRPTGAELWATYQAAGMPPVFHLDQAQGRKKAMTPEQADAAQEWKGMDGAVAWHLIYRYAEDWAETEVMMNAWLRANAAVAVLAEREACAAICDEDVTLLSGDPVLQGMADGAAELAAAMRARSTTT